MHFPAFSTPIVKAAVRQWRRHLAGRWAGPGLDGSQLLILRAQEQATYLQDKANLQLDARGNDEAKATSAKVALGVLANREAQQNKRDKPWRR